jgi:hypothetical protein
MNPVRRWLILIGVLIIAGILAFPLRETIYEIVVIPAAFVAWNLNLVYQSFSQGIWWWVLMFLVLFMIIFSLIPRPQLRPKSGPKPKPPQGQVESLATWLRRAEGGIYFKWLVANRLGKLAYQILLQRENGRPRSVFAPLVGEDWEPTKKLQKYLETGLHGSFADFPNTRRRFSTRQPTPLDIEVGEAVDFLELQIDNHNLPQSQRGPENL